MDNRVQGISYSDPYPERIDSAQWHALFKNIPAEYIDYYRYYRYLGKMEWNTYLFPPTTFAIYGSRYLKKLKFDNSLASLRLWGFMLSESERLYRAKQSGRKIIACMGDLGAIPPLVYSFPDLIPFYPDCYWWTPFLNESPVLFDEAKLYGIGDDCCFVRAALGAYSKLAYFPRPDLNIGATGASCDDMAGVMQRINSLGHDIYWFEIPHRRHRLPNEGSDEYRRTRSHGIAYQPYLEPFLKEQFKALTGKLESVSDYSFSAVRFQESVRKINRMRTLIAEIKECVFVSRHSILPALEIMNLEFMALAGYSDLDEAVDILIHMKETVSARKKQNLTVREDDPVRVIWVTPPADPLLLNYLEDIGGKLAGTEFVINQALFPLSETNDPASVLTDGMLNGSLMGTARSRADEIITQAKAYNADGVVMSTVFASSHCSSETPLMKEIIKRETGLPVLSFNVVEPGKKMLQSQTLNRMEAFMELLKSRRQVIV